MKDWIAYIKENLDNDIWGFIFLDYYYSDSYKKHGEKIEDYEPEKFINEEILKLYGHYKDPVHFHKILLKICVHLLFDSKNHVESSTNLIFNKSHRFLIKNRQVLNEQQIQEIILHYGHSNDDNGYRKKDAFRNYLISKRFIKESTENSQQSNNKASGKRRDEEKNIKEKKEIKVLDSNTLPKKKLPVVVILTALQEEYLAVRKNIKNIVDADTNDTTYEKGIFELYEREIAKVIIRECGTGNTIASQETERAIQYFKPDILLFVGIAGSRKPNDFSIGDVIFPVKIYSYEAGRSGKDSFCPRPEVENVTYTLSEIAKKERRKEDWKELIKTTWHKDVKANLGSIASGEQLIEHYDSEIGMTLTNHYNDTQAVEMEGFGFAKVLARQGRETNKILFGVVRGISDIIEQSDSSEIIGDRRPDNVKHFASDTAAAFAFWLIFKTLK